MNNIEFKNKEAENLYNENQGRYIFDIYAVDCEPDLSKTKENIYIGTILKGGISTPQDAINLYKKNTKYSKQLEWCLEQVIKHQTIRDFPLDKAYLLMQADKCGIICSKYEEDIYNLLIILESLNPQSELYRTLFETIKDRIGL